MHQRRHVAAEVAEKLFRAEFAIDTALVRTAELMGVLPSARRRARIAATIGQPAVDGAAGAVEALSRARASIVATHDELAGTHRRIGLGRFASGPVHDKPDEDGVDPARLRIIADDHAA